MASTGPRPRGRGNHVDFTITCFQNPASTGPRPRGRGNRTKMPTPIDKEMLQRGRARAGAEISSWWLHSKATRIASTGPRPRGRGNLTTELCRAVKLKLQRGRARAGAEIGFAVCRAGLLLRASTGPRPRGRGNWNISDRGETTRLASTGPRPRGRGNSGNAGIIRSARDCFNGAAPARARK